MACKRSLPVWDRGIGQGKRTLTCLLGRILILSEPSAHDLDLSKLTFLEALSLKTAVGGVQHINGVGRHSTLTKINTQINPNSEVWKR